MYIQDGDYITLCGYPQGHQAVKKAPVWRPGPSFPGANDPVSDIRAPNLPAWRPVMRLPAWILPRD